MFEINILLAIIRIMSKRKPISLKCFIKPKYTPFYSWVYNCIFKMLVTKTRCEMMTSIY